jgi:hypothetical protein
VHSTLLHSLCCCVGCLHVSDGGVVLTVLPVMEAAPFKLEGDWQLLRVPHRLGPLAMSAAAESRGGVRPRVGWRDLQGEGKPCDCTAVCVVCNDVAWHPV